VHGTSLTQSNRYDWRIGAGRTISDAYLQFVGSRRLSLILRCCWCRLVWGICLHEFSTILKSRSLRVPWILLDLVKTVAFAMDFVLLMSCFDEYSCSKSVKHVPWAGCSVQILCLDGEAELVPTWLSWVAIFNQFCQIMIPLFTLWFWRVIGGIRRVYVCIDEIFKVVLGSRTSVETQTMKMVFGFD